MTNSHTASDPTPPDHVPPAPERDLTVQDRLHPVVYGTIVGLALWLVGSAWVLFGGADYDGITLVVVTGLFAIAIAIPVLLWRTWLRNGGDGADQVSPPFRAWRSGQFATWTGEHRGTGAALEILLPIAAVAFGMTAIGLVYHLAATGMS